MDSSTYRGTADGQRGTCGGACTLYNGMCEPSAGVALDATHFAVASDEIEYFADL